MELIVGGTDIHKDKETDRQTDGKRDRQKERWTNRHGHMGNQTNGFRNELAQRETNAIHTCTVIPHLETLRRNVAQEHCTIWVLYNGVLHYCYLDLFVVVYNLTLISSIHISTIFTTHLLRKKNVNSPKILTLAKVVQKLLYEIISKLIKKFNLYLTSIYPTKTLGR